MTISINDHMLPEETYNRYDLTFFDLQFPILLTFSPPMVDQWIADLSVTRPQPFLVGFDVEWRPNFANTDHPVATIQLCGAGHRGPTCLIFQILHSPYVPQSLVDFLGDTANTFFGVGIAEDVEKLLCDYDLRVANAVDLRDLAPDEMKKAGLKTMGKELLGKDVQKPKTIQRSRWDNLWLTPAQVQYACLDAFLSFEIGRRLSEKPATSPIESIPMLTSKNFDEWKEKVMLVLGLMNLDLALRTDQPAIPTDQSSSEAQNYFEQWERSNRQSLMIMQDKAPEHYGGALSEETDAKSFLAAIERHFPKNEKVETSMLLSYLVSMRYQGKGNVREHILEMSCLASKLKKLKLDISEDLLVHLVLISLPAQFDQLKVVYNNSIKEKWALNDLISHCVHEEERQLEQHEMENAVLRQRNSDRVVCFFCKNSGHMKKDCTLYHARRLQKGLPELPRPSWN